MKRALCLALLAVMLSGCGTTYDKYVSVDSLPYNMEVDDGVQIALKDVHFYYLPDSSGYEYYPIAVVTFDTSNLDDRTLYFLQKDDAGMVDCMIDSEANNLDNEHLTEVYETAANNELQFFFMDYSKKYRENFQDIAGTIIVTPVNDDLTDDKTGIIYMAGFNGYGDHLKAYVNLYGMMPENDKLALSVGLRDIQNFNQALSGQN